MLSEYSQHISWKSPPAVLWNTEIRTTNVVPTLSTTRSWRTAKGFSEQLGGRFAFYLDKQRVDRAVCSPSVSLRITLFLSLIYAPSVFLFRFFLFFFWSKYLSFEFKKSFEPSIGFNSLEDFAGQLMIPTLVLMCRSLPFFIDAPQSYKCHSDSSPAAGLHGGGGQLFWQNGCYICGWNDRKVWKIYQRGKIKRGMFLSSDLQRAFQPVVSSDERELAECFFLRLVYVFCIWTLYTFWFPDSPLRISCASSD